MANRNGEGITIYFEGNTVNFDKSTDGIKKALDILKKMTSAYMKEYKKTGDINTFAKAVGNLAEEQRVAAMQVQAWADEVARLNREGKTSSDQYKNAIKQWATANDRLVKIGIQLDKNVELVKEMTSSAAIGELNKKLEQTGDVLLDVGDKTEALGNAFKGLSDEAQKGLDYAKDRAIAFESAFADVEKTVNATPDEFRELRTELRELSTVVPTTADDLARIAGLAGQMNVPVDQLIDFTKAMVDFGNSTNISAEQATEDIAQIYNVIGKGGDFSSLNRLLSSIVELGNNSATTERDIVQMFTNIAAGASRVGLTEEQMAALAATLSSLNLDKGGASAISKILTKIDVDLAHGGESMQKWLDISTLGAEEFVRVWKNDPANALLSVLQGVAELEENGENLNLVLEQLDISELRQIDTFSRLVNAQGEYSKNLDLASAAYRDGNALIDEANKRYKTTESRIKILKNVFDNFALSLGETFLPLVNKIVDFGIKIGDILNNLSPGAKQLIAIIMGLVAGVAPLLLGVSALSKRLGGFVKDVLPNLLSGNLGILNVLKPIFQWITKLATGPLGVLIGILATLYLTNEDIRNQINTLVQSLIGLFKPTIELIINIIKIVWAILKEVVNIIIVMWQEFAKSEAGKKFIEIIKQIISWVQTAIDWISKLVGWLVDATNWFLNLLGIASDFNSTVGQGGGYGGNSSAVINSGGFASGGAITLNANFTINSNNIGRADVKQWSSWIADDINEALGRKIR